MKVDNLHNMEMEINVISSDEEDVEIAYVIRRPYTLREKRNHFDDWDNTDFFYRFRLLKGTVEILLESIGPERLESTWNRSRSLSPLQQLLLTLRFYATGSFLRTIGDFAGVSVATACRTVKKVTLAIASLRPHFIKMPRTEGECRRLQSGFHRMYNFPKVIGCIDCTHVRIQSPGGANAEVFCNRKGYFSVNVQAVCDHDMKILDVVARWPGSAHDATIFNQSTLCAMFENNEFANAWILGDSAYPLKSYLLTPLQNPNNRGEQQYNHAHIHTRNIIERVFGVWKRRFPILSMGLRLRMATIQDIIIATAVLHNICRAENEEPPAVMDIELEVPDPHFQYPINIEDNAVRNALINDYFARQ